MVLLGHFDLSTSLGLTVWRGTSTGTVWLCSPAGNAEESQSSGFVLPGTCQPHNPWGRLRLSFILQLFLWRSQLQLRLCSNPVSGHVPGLCQARASVGMRGSLVSGGLPAGFVAFCHPLPGLVSQPHHIPGSESTSPGSLSASSGMPQTPVQAMEVAQWGWRNAAGWLGCDVPAVPSPIPCAACGWNES